MLEMSIKVTIEFNVKYILANFFHPFGIICFDLKNFSNLQYYFTEAFTHNIFILYVSLIFLSYKDYFE